MKKISILLLALMAINLVFAQGGKQKNSQKAKSAFDEKIKPILVESQKEFYKILSDEEMAQINQLKSEVDLIRSEAAKEQDREKCKTQIIELNSKANIIAEAHPKEAKAYTKKMNSLMEDVQKQKKGKGNNQKANKPKQDRPMLKNISDPGFLLLWNENRKPQHNGNYGKKTSFIKENPEIMNELQKYASANILPILSEKRLDFNKNLNDDEKDQIALARGKIKVRQEMYKAWRESDDFEPGARRTDSEFDYLREDMQKSMKQIRQIALDHNEEITSIKNELKPNSDKWKSDIVQIMEKYDVDAPKAAQKYSAEFKKSTTPIAFVLFDPENLETSKFFRAKKR